MSFIFSPFQATLPTEQCSKDSKLYNEGQIWGRINRYFSRQPIRRVRHDMAQRAGVVKAWRGNPTPPRPSPLQAHVHQIYLLPAQTIEYISGRKQRKAPPIDWPSYWTGTVLIKDVNRYGMSYRYKRWSYRYWNFYRHHRSSPLSVHTHPHCSVQSLAQSAHCVAYHW